MAKKQQTENTGKSEAQTTEHFNSVANEVAGYLNRKLDMNFMLIGVGRNGCAIAGTLRPKQAIQLLKEAIKSYEDKSQPIIDRGNIEDC